MDEVKVGPRRHRLALLSLLAGLSWVVGLVEGQLSLQPLGGIDPRSPDLSKATAISANGSWLEGSHLGSCQGLAIMPHRHHSAGRKAGECRRVPLQLPWESQAFRLTVR